MKRMAVVLGTLVGVWCGPADEVLVGSDDFAVRRDVAAGTLTWTERAAGPVSAVLPTDLTNGLAFWVDANTNVVADAAGAVRAWLDVREAPVADEADWAARTEAGDWSYTRALLYTATEKYAGVPPTIETDREGFAGLRFIDFGEYGSGRWLMWADAQGNRRRVAVRSYFCVVGFGASAGFILADVDNPAQGGWGFTPYHKGSGGGNGTDDAISAYNENDSHMMFGETRLNGVRVDPRVTKYARHAVQLFGQNGPAVYKLETCPEPWVSTFFNNSNWKQVDGQNDRQGGGQLGEILCYDRVLTDDERVRVEAYLRQKWFGGATAGRMALAAGTAFVADVAQTATMRGVEGAGTLVKRGAGTLDVAEGAGLFAGGLRLEEGAVTLARKHALPALDAFGAATVEVAADGVRRVAGVPDAAGTFTIRGTDASTSVHVPLGTVAEEVTTLDVTDATVVLRPAADIGTSYRPATAFERIGNLIRNGGFEATSMTGSWSGGQQITVEGWREVAPTNGGTASWGLTKTGTPWLDGAVSVPEGQVAVFLQGRQDADNNVQGRLRQTVEVPVAGLYRLSFQATRRTSKAVCNVGVWLDDRYVFVRRIQDSYRMAAGGGYEVDRAATDFQTMGCDLPLTAGPHDLTFEVTLDDTADRAVVLDDVRLVPLVEGAFAWVAGAGFESVPTGLSTGMVGQHGLFSDSPTGAFWTFEDGVYATTNFVDNVDGSVTTNIVVYDGGAGIARTPSTWFWDGRAEEAFEDNQVAFIQRTAALENTVVFPHAGRVCLSVRYANRSWYVNRSGSRPTGHACRVTLDGAELASFAPAVSTMTTFRHVFEVTAGAHAVRFQGVVPDAQDYSVILDDVRFQYVDDEPGIVKDPSFANGFSEEGWAAHGTVERLRFADRDVAAVGLAGTASLARTFTTPSNGVWTLTFDAVGRPVDLASANGVYNNFRFYPHRVGVWVDAVRVGALVANSPCTATFTLRLPWLAAGPHTLRFEGETAEPEEARTLVGGVRIDPLAVRDAPPDLAERTLRLNGSARAVLDFADPLRVGRVRLDGAFVTGVLDATTHPDWFEGPGQVLVKARATVLILR